MSAEGETNLDNDGAGDVLYSLAQNLFDRITTLLEHPNGHHYDDGYISELFALIEVAFALDERKILYFSPPPLDFSGRFESFQQRWQEYHRSAGHDPPLERAKTMKETFERLSKICHARSDDGEYDDDEIPGNEATSEQMAVEETLRNIFEGLQR